MSLFKRAMLSTLVIPVCFITSCTSRNNNYQRGRNTNKEVTTIEIRKDEVVKFNEEPLRILYAYRTNYWGMP